MAVRISVSIAGTALKVFDSMTVDGAVIPYKCNRDRGRCEYLWILLVLPWKCLTPRRLMALWGKINATVIEGAANISQYFWYCLEGVWLHDHNSWLFDDDFTGLTVDGSGRQDECNPDRGRCEYLWRIYRNPFAEVWVDSDNAAALSSVNLVQLMICLVVW